MEDPRAEERVGSVLHDKWTLERLIGMGGVGAVYAARHRNGARAAIKVLSPTSARQPGIRERFLREGYAANRVEHSGAVKVLDDDTIASGPDEGTPYIVMELLDGESLQTRAEHDPPLKEHDLLEIADGVLAVLEAAHTNGVVHRDLKPDNLFLTHDPDRGTLQVKVLDFGLARLAEKGDRTFHGRAVGTPTYMSPEQAAGQTDLIDGRTDIYALGSMMFQLVSNKRIHEAQHTLGLVVRMATTPAPKLRTVAPDVSEAYASIVDRALAFKRDDRYASAQEMREAVKSVRASMQPAAAKAEVSSLLVAVPQTGVNDAPVVAPEPSLPVGPEPPPPAKPTSGRSGGTLAVVAALLITAIALVVVTARLGSGSTTPTAGSQQPAALVSSASLSGSASATLLAEDPDGGPDAGDEEDDDDDDGGVLVTSALPPPPIPTTTTGTNPQHFEKQPPRKRPPRRIRRRRRRHW